MLINDEMQKLLPVNVIRTGFKEHQYHIIRNDGFAAYQISVCTDGSGKFVYENVEYVINKGDIFMFFPRTPHEYFPISEKWSLYFFVFMGDCLGDLMKYFGFSEVTLLTAGVMYDDILGLCKKINVSEDSFSLSLSMYELIGKMGTLSRLTSTESTLERKEQFKKIAPVIDYIKKHYMNTVELDALAELIGVSKSYLCRLFNDTLEMTPIKYLLHHRIYRARQLLISTDMKTKQIALDVGFNDPSYFCMIFKRFEGITPEEFRALHND